MAPIDPPDRTHFAKLAADSAQSKILHNLVSIASSAANGQLSQVVLRVADALMQFSDTCSDTKQAGLSFNASNVLKKNIYAFHFLATATIQKSLQREVDALETPLKSARSKEDEILSLVPYADMDKRLMLSNMARPLDATHADQLTALRIRIAHLLGREELSNNQNPFRPEILLSAINDTWIAFNPDTETHQLVLPLLKPEVFMDLAPILKALNHELIRSGILPELADFYNIKKTTGNQDSRKKGDRLNPATLQQLRQIFSPESDASSMATIPDIPMMPMIPGHINVPGSGYAGTGSSGFAHQPLQAAVSSSQLLDFLAVLQKNQGGPSALGHTGFAAPVSMLGNIKAQAPQGAITRVDESTIDLLTKIFDVVFRDQNIPTEIKGLIGYLQVPVLKTALLDKDFFFKEEHPARRLIELLTKQSVGWDQSKGQDDPLYQIIKRNVQRVQQESDHQASVFSDVVSDLESFIQQEENTAAQALSEPIAQALQQEKLGQAVKAAKNEVALRVGTGEVVAFVETFLENRWVSVLTLAYSLQDEKPQAVDSALKTMDDLVWSVKPKATMAERKELIAKLPAMLSMLNKWLNLVNLDDADRLQFFAELAECHASIVRAPLEMSPQRRLEIAMEVAKQAAERRLQKRTVQEPEPVTDDFVDHVEKLERGMWLEFTQEESPTKKVKLSWVSPLRSLYIFSSKDKAESFSLSAEDLAQTLREGRARVILLSGLVDRAITEAFENTGANDANMDQKSVA